MTEYPRPERTPEEEIAHLRQVVENMKTKRKRHRELINSLQTHLREARTALGQSMSKRRQLERDLHEAGVQRRNAQDRALEFQRKLESGAPKKVEVLEALETVRKLYDAARAHGLANTDG